MITYQTIIRDVSVISESDFDLVYSRHRKFGQLRAKVLWGGETGDHWISLPNSWVVV